MGNTGMKTARNRERTGIEERAAYRSEWTGTAT